MIRSKIEFSDDEDGKGINTNPDVTVELTMKDNFLLNEDGLFQFVLAFRQALEGIGFEKEKVKWLNC